MDHPASHEDIITKIDLLETDIKGWVVSGVIKAAIVLAPFIIASFVWFWTSYSAQASVNAALETKIDAKVSQLDRIDSKIDQMYRFMREDSMEQRRALQDHISAAQDSNQ